MKTIIVSKGKEYKKTHDLIVIAKDSQLKLPKEFQEYVDELNPHYQPSRYPDIRYKEPILRYNEQIARHHVKETKKLFLWITKKLTSKN